MLSDSLPSPACAPSSPDAADASAAQASLHDALLARLRTGALATSSLRACRNAEYRRMLYAVSCQLAAHGLAYVPASPTTHRSLDASRLDIAGTAMRNAYTLFNFGETIDDTDLDDRGIACRDSGKDGVTLTVLHRALQKKGLVLVEAGEAAAATVDLLPAYAPYISRALWAEMALAQVAGIRDALRGHGIALQRGATSRLQDHPAAPALIRRGAQATATWLGPQRSKSETEDEAADWISLGNPHVALAPLDDALRRAGWGSVPRPYPSDYALEAEEHNIAWRRLAYGYSAFAGRAWAQALLQGLADAVEILDLRLTDQPCHYEMPVEIGRALGFAIALAGSEHCSPAHSPHDHLKAAARSVVDGWALTHLRILIDHLAARGIHIAPPVSKRAWMNPVGKIRHHRFLARHGHGPRYREHYDVERDDV